jgi:hypothetical protein
MVSGLTSWCRITRPVPPKAEEKMSVSLCVNCPVGRGRPLVLAITASIFSSIKQLKAAAAPQTKAMPRLVKNNISIGTIIGVAKNIPIIAVKTIR